MECFKVLTEIERVLRVCLEEVKGLGIEAHQKLVDCLVAERLFAEVSKIDWDQNSGHESHQEQIFDEVWDLVKESTARTILELVNSDHL